MYRQIYQSLCINIPINILMQYVTAMKIIYICRYMYVASFACIRHEP